MMQIFIRRLGEVLFIGDDIRITVLAIRDDEVRLGIDAPKSVPVQREETYDKKD